MTTNRLCCIFGNYSQTKLWKVHKVCETLFESGVSISTPTQSGNNRAVMKNGEK